ncbi:hypothetical protein LBMAG42_55390 [Deltaproteobacteria bacterium]|nr:hypothetical protein LBMAG42_55390 [Deltaproteobacteria bacterium]
MRTCFLAPFVLLAGCSETAKDTAAPTDTADTAAQDTAANSGTDDIDPNSVDDDGDGYAEEDGDCDDGNAAANPGEDEVWYDDVDEACDGGDDFDQDGDGFDMNEDCNDEDSRVNPDAVEAANGADDDCDGLIDNGTDSGDDDGDGYSEADGDCDDADSARHPGASEVCDGAVDEDCDGTVDEADAVLGSDADCPATTCLEIHYARPAAPDDTYWISVGGVAHEVVCDMTRDTGGWTLVANFIWPGTTNGIPGWTSGSLVGTTTTDRTQSWKLDDSDINALVSVRYRARGLATFCTLEDRSTGACAVDTTLYWDSACVYTSGSTSTGACTAAYQTYDLDAWTELSNPCSWHYGLTSADCGVTSEFGTSHEGDHVFAGIVGTYIHGYDGRPSEDPGVEVWVR